MGTRGSTACGGIKLVHTILDALIRPDFDGRGGSLHPLLDRIIFVTSELA